MKLTRLVRQKGKENEKGGILIINEDREFTAETGCEDIEYYGEDMELIDTPISGIILFTEKEYIIKLDNGVTFSKPKDADMSKSNLGWI